MPIKDHIKGFGGMVGRGLEGAAATGIIAGATAGAHHVYNALTKARDFKEMLSSPFNADLQDVHKNDPTRFNSAFNSLRSVHAPLTQDPMVAGAYMRRIMSYDNAGATGILVEALSQKDRMPANPITEAMARGGQIGVQGVFTNRINQMSDDRQPGVQAAGEKAKLELRTYGPLADKMDLDARSMKKFEAKQRGKQEKGKLDYQETLRAKAEAAKAAKEPSTEPSTNLVPPAIKANFSMSRPAPGFFNSNPQPHFDLRNSGSSASPTTVPRETLQHLAGMQAANNPMPPMPGGKGGKNKRP